MITDTTVTGGSVVENPGIAIELDEDIDFDAPASLAFFDFSVCPESLDQEGKASWSKLVELQAHVRITRLKRQLSALRAAVLECGVCGCRPCINPNFCVACQQADRRRARYSR
jgi:hypothetical protein